MFTTVLTTYPRCATGVPHQPVGAVALHPLHLQPAELVERRRPLRGGRHPRHPLYGAHRPQGQSPSPPAPSHPLYGTHCPQGQSLHPLTPCHPLYGAHRPQGQSPSLAARILTSVLISDISNHQPTKACELSCEVILYEVASHVKKLPFQLL